MKCNQLLGIVLGFILIAVVPAAAEENLVDSVANGCKKELETLCEGVTPGEGRVLACLYAYGDKISGQCEYALYDAAAQLERAVAALTYMANECADDLDQFCGDVAVGEGRLLECLDKQSEKVSQRCKDAVTDVAKKQ
jgi:hypothetical protein